MVFICVKNWFMKPIPSGRWSNTLENLVTKSILNSWKELIFFFLAGLYVLPTRNCLCARLTVSLFVYICVPFVLCPVPCLSPFPSSLPAPKICWHNVLDSKENVSVVKLYCILGICFPLSNPFLLWLVVQLIYRRTDV